MNNNFAYCAVRFDKLFYLRDRLHKYLIPQTNFAEIFIRSAVQNNVAEYLHDRLHKKKLLGIHKVDFIKKSYWWATIKSASL